MSLHNATYINQLIQDGNNDSLGIQNFYSSTLLANQAKDHIIRIPIGDFFVQHMDEFRDIIQIYNIPETMFYRPKMLSLEVYGTTELWLAILRLNKMRNVTEFHKPVILLWNADSIKELINVFFKREA